MDFDYFISGMFIGCVALLAGLFFGKIYLVKCSLVFSFALAYIGAGIDYGRRGIDDLRAIHIMFIVGWPVFLIAILMLFPNQKK